MWANCIVIAAIILQVILRYGFGHGLVILEELQWHFYAVAFMFGLSYAVMTDSHVGMDLVYDRLYPNGSAAWIFSESFFCCCPLPACFVIRASILSTNPGGSTNARSHPRGCPGAGRSNLSCPFICHGRFGLPFASGSNHLNLKETVTHGDQ